MSARVYVGTVGSGVWSSDDLGETWDSHFNGNSSVNRVWSLCWHHGEPNVVWAGTERGLARKSGDSSAQLVSSPFSDRQVWAIGQSPSDYKTMYVGTRPGCIYRTIDAGSSWEELSVGIATECDIEEGTVWASVEIDAVHVTHDFGENWQKLDNGFKFPDIHDLVVAVEDGKRKLLAATAVGLYCSSDEGQSWEWKRLDSPWQYTRGIELKANGNGTVFLGNGDGPPGSTGRLLRSEDMGCSWVEADLSNPTNSTLWNIATNKSNPDLLFASTILGQVFRSTDGGFRWIKLPREFNEIRSLIWHPF